MSEEQKAWLEEKIYKNAAAMARESLPKTFRRYDKQQLSAKFRKREDELRVTMRELDPGKDELPSQSFDSTIKRALRDTITVESEKYDPLDYLEREPFKSLLIEYGCLLASLKPCDKEEIDWQRIGLTAVLISLLQREKTDKTNRSQLLRRSVHVRRHEFCTDLQRDWDIHDLSKPKTTRRHLSVRKIFEVSKRVANGEIEAPESDPTPEYLPDSDFTPASWLKKEIAVDEDMDEQTFKSSVSKGKKMLKIG